MFDKKYITIFLICICMVVGVAVCTYYFTKKSIKPIVTNQIIKGKTDTVKTVVKNKVLVYVDRPFPVYRDTLKPLPIFPDPIISIDTLAADTTSWVHIVSNDILKNGLEIAYGYTSNDITRIDTVNNTTPGKEINILLDPITWLIAAVAFILGALAL